MPYGHKTQSFMKNGGQRKCLDKPLMMYPVICNIGFCVQNNKVIANPSRPNHKWREKVKINFYFHTSLWCLKRSLKAFIKPFEALQRSVKIKIWVNFYFNINYINAHRTGKVKWFRQNNFSSVNSSQIDVISENLVDVVRAARSTFIVEQYNIALGKRFPYT